MSDLVRTNDINMKLNENLKKLKQDGFKIINLEVRETQLRAIQLYEQAGYVRFGINPRSVFLDGKYIAGYYYYKELSNKKRFGTIP